MVVLVRVPIAQFCFTIDLQWDKEIMQNITLNVMNILWNKILIKKKNVSVHELFLPTGISAWDYLYPKTPSLKSIFE